jgi:hypothetical protein
LIAKNKKVDTGKEQKDPQSTTSIPRKNDDQEAKPETNTNTTPPKANNLEAHREIEIINKANELFSSSSSHSHDGEESSEKVKKEIKKIMANIDNDSYVLITILLLSRNSHVSSH